MSDVVGYEQRGELALITLDDGKANALSLAVITQLHEALDRAEHDDTVKGVVIAGRPGVLSGGFDLAVMKSGDARAVVDLVATGGELVLRIYRFGKPVVAAVTGHAVAAGALLALGSHYRVAAEGAFRIVLVETAIGLVMPDWGLLMAQERLNRSEVQQAVIESKVYDPAGAAAAGFVDRVVPPDGVLDTAIEEATRLAAFNARTYAGVCAKVRGPGGDAVAAALGRDREALQKL
jgi:enoyl-CoA hydratase